MSNDRRKVRLIAGLCALIFMFCVFSGLLFRAQIVKHEEYSAAGTGVSVSTSKVPAARGVILDCNGKALAENRQGNTIVFEYALFPGTQEERNKVIFALLRLFASQGETWEDSFPIDLDANGVPCFREDCESKITFLKSEEMLHLNDYATAQNCYDATVKKYKLSAYDTADARNIAAVCFGMRYTVFNSSNSYVFAKDVSTETVAQIKERSDLYKGVNVEIDCYRSYTDGMIAPHILGIVSGISADEYEAESAALEEKLKDSSLSAEELRALRNNAYTINDTYGKSGIEAYAEKYLRGTVGVKSVSTDSDGNVSVDYEILPVEGDTVVSTVDSGLQKACADALQKVLDEQKDVTVFGTAGAMVVIDVKTGAIKACVSNPTYDIATYLDDYGELVKAKNAPLWNRALLSAYAPGSTMKPAIALAGLTEGVLTPSSTVTCLKYYHYLDTTFECMQSHGTLNVRQSLRYSCNIFYYDTGKNLGIERMNKYCSLLGLGEKTGVELPETSGVLASVAYRESQGGVWNPGDTVQAAIGQSDNLFTPLQLANYCATIANGGTRYKPYIIDSVYSSDMKTLVFKTEPTVAAQTGFSADNIELVKLGMKDVVDYGGCSTYFKNCVVKAAAKTGTSQVFKTTDSGASIKTNNGFVISFAPFDDPQIAVCIACENVLSGSSISKAVCEVYNYWFTSSQSFEIPENYGELIS